MTTIQFIVSDVSGTYIPDAKVIFLKEGMEKHGKLSYDHRTAYTLEYDASLLDDQTKIEVQHEGYESVIIELSRLKAGRRVYLGELGSKYIRRGNMDMPFLPQTDKAGGLLANPQALDTLINLLKNDQYQIDRLEGSESVVLISRKDGLAIDQEIYEQWRQSGWFLSVGPVLNAQRETFAFLTNQLDIQFSNTVTQEDITDLYQQYQLEQLSTYTFAPQLFSVKSNNATGMDIIEMADAIRQHKAVNNVDIQIYENIGQRKNIKGFGHR